MSPESYTEHLVFNLHISIFFLQNMEQQTVKKSKSHIKIYISLIAAIFFNTVLLEFRNAKQVEKLKNTKKQNKTDTEKGLHSRTQLLFLITHPTHPPPFFVE